jgi:hypothetical protein
MLGELATHSCWLGLSYFFWQGDCWPTMVNHTSTVTRRLPSAVPEIVLMYHDYLRIRIADDVARRKILVIRNEPLSGPFVNGIENLLVATAETLVDGRPVRAYGYLQNAMPAARH